MFLPIIAQAYLCDATFGRSARDALFVVGNSDDQEGDEDKPRGDASCSGQHLPTVSPGPVDAGSTAGSDYRRIKFGRIRKFAGQRGTRALGANLERQRLRTLRMPHGRMVTPTE